MEVISGMNEECKKVIRDIFSNSGYDVMFLSYNSLEDEANWKKFCDNVEYLPVKYTWTDLKYQASYTACFNNEVFNYLLLMKHNNKFIAGWPITIINVLNDKYKICTNSGCLLEPIFVNNISEKIKSKIDNLCIEILLKFANYKKFTNTIHLNHRFFPIKLNYPWYRKIMELGGKAYVVNECFVDLGLSMPVIMQSFRKRYRSFINYGNKNFEIKIKKYMSKEHLIDLKNMHIEVAGRQTRSDETWNIQLDAINAGDILAAEIYDSNKMIGYGLFYLSKDECYYGVGVFDRTLFDMPISHFLQSEIIKYLKNNTSVKYYYIGQRMYEGDYRKPTEKELSISYFKEGFATNSEINIETILSVTRKGEECDFSNSTSEKLIE